MVIDGGDGGNLIIAVDQDDLDLLVACKWSTTAGAGGASGQHGRPGDGGSGGRGGASYIWTEFRNDSVYVHTKAAGPTGDEGYPGRQPCTYLSGGKAGRNGIAQIRVMSQGWVFATYPGCYKLEVTGFALSDENRDGINEPGEHLDIENVTVKNKGK